MNYIKQINSFWDISDTLSLSDGEIALYFALMYFANKNRWSRSFSAHNALVMGKARISGESQLCRLRKKLMSKGLITYINGKKGIDGVYSIVKLYEGADAPAETDTQTERGLSDSKTDDCQTAKTRAVRGQSGSIYKQKDKHKTYYPPLSPEAITERYTENPELRREIKTFLSEQKKPVTERRLNALLQNLSSLEKTDEGRIAVVKQSIRKGWLDFYALNKGGGIRNQSQTEIFNSGRYSDDDISQLMIKY